MAYQGADYEDWTVGRLGEDCGDVSDRIEVNRLSANCTY